MVRFTFGVNCNSLKVFIKVENYIDKKFAIGTMSGED
jgi:hypothetical protein